MTSKADNQFMAVDQAASQLGLPPAVLQELVDNGRVPSIRVEGEGRNYVHLGQAVEHLRREAASRLTAARDERAGDPKEQLHRILDDLRLHSDPPRRHPGVADALALASPIEFRTARSSRWSLVRVLDQVYRLGPGEGDMQRLGDAYDPQATSGQIWAGGRLRPNPPSWMLRVASGLLAQSPALRGGSHSNKETDHGEQPSD